MFYFEPLLLLDIEWLFLIHCIYWGIHSNCFAGDFLYRKKKLIIILCLAEKHWRSWSTISHDTSISDQVRILMQISTSLLYQRQSIPVNLFMMPCGQANSMFPFVSWIKVYFSSWNAQNILTVSNLSYKCTVFYALFWSSCFMMIWSYSAILSECFMINWYNNYVLCAILLDAP